MAVPSLPACCFCFLLASASVTVKGAQAAPGEGKEIADRFGEDLNFASKQLIRGFTALFGPLLDTAQSSGLSSKAAAADDQGGANFRKVLLRDGINALGKGVKSGATILTVPARVAGTGIEEFQKAGQAGIESRLGSPEPKPAGTPGAARQDIDDKTKIASTLLNTTASELSQANLGAVMVEIALKKRVKDIANRTAGVLVQPRPAEHEVAARHVADDASEQTVAAAETTTSKVDELLGRFNEAVRRNDERVLDALKAVLSQINPPKN